MLVEDLALRLDSTAPRWQQVNEMAELQVGQRVWILIRLRGVVLDYDTEEANDPYSGNRIGLDTSLNQLHLALSRGTARRSEIMANPPTGEDWKSRVDLSIGQKVVADFTFTGIIIWTPESGFPNDPETQYGIKLDDPDALKMKRLYSVGELMPGPRIHKLPPAV